MRALGNIRRLLVATATAGAVVLASPAAGLACTALLISDGPDVAVAKSYDWDNGLGLLVVNRRGVAKAGMPAREGDTAPTWVSKHASVTFNQYGQEMPNGGMNEAGLVVEVLWLQETRYPRPDSRPALNELQWIQYQLDNHATVADVVAGAPGLRVAAAYAKVHYLVCDRTGACAAVEYIDGKLAIAAGADMPVKALTNDPYADSVASLPKAGQPPPQGRGSLPRFARAAAATRAGAGAPLVKRAFEALDSVRQPGYTQWNIVYEPARGMLHFRTATTPAVRTVDLGKLAGGCSQPVMALDLDAALEGDVTAKLAPLEPARNRKLVEESMARLGSKLAPAQIEGLVMFPSHLRCVAP